MTSLQSEITRLGGTVSSSLEFRFPVDSKEAEESVEIFRQTYHDQIEDLGINDGFASFRLIPSKLAELPTDTASLIFDYLPDNDPAHQKEEETLEIQEYRLKSNSRRESLTTTVKDNPEYFTWLGSHSHLKHLHLFIPEEFEMNDGFRTAITKLTELESLKLSGFITFKIIVEFAPVFPYLLSLDLNELNLGDDVYTDEEGFADLIHVMSTATHLQNLDIGNNGFDEKSAQMLVGMIEFFPYLERLNLMVCVFEHETVTRLLEILKTRPLKGLEIDGDELIDVFPDFLNLLSKTPNLEVLRTGHFEINPSQVSQLCQQLQMLTHLTTFTVEILNLSFESFAELCSVLEHLPDLTSFDIVLHPLKYKEVVKMIPIYENHPKMKSINLTRHKLDIEGLLMLVPYLMKLTQLEEFHFDTENGFLEDKFRPEIIAMILSNVDSQSLRVFDPGEIEIDSSGMKSLSGTLARFENLKELRFQGCIFHSDTGDYLAELLEHLNLETLSFTYCVFQFDIESLPPSIAKQTSLTSFSLLPERGSNNLPYKQIYGALGNLTHLRTLVIDAPRGLGQDYADLLTKLPDIVFS